MGWFKSSRHLNSIHKHHVAAERKAKENIERKCWEIKGVEVITYVEYGMYTGVTKYCFEYPDAQITWRRLKESFTDKDEANEFFKSLKAMTDEEFYQLRCTSDVKC